MLKFINLQKFLILGFVLFTGPFALALEKHNKALLLAAKNGDLKTARSLLARKDISTHEKHAALDIALLNERKQVALFLLKQPGLDINAYKHDGGCSSLFFAAVSQGYLDAVSLMLDRFDVDINCEDEYQDMALNIAAEYGHEKVFAFLLRHPQIKVDSSVLVSAARGGNKKILSTLLSRTDIDVNALPSGHTALMAAVINGRKGAVEILLKHSEIEINAADEDGWAALSYVPHAYWLEESSPPDEIVPLLLSHPQISVNTLDNDGKTALAHAIAEGRESVIQLLLQDPRVDGVPWSSMLEMAEEVHRYNTAETFMMLKYSLLSKMPQFVREWWLA